MSEKRKPVFPGFPDFKAGTAPKAKVHEKLLLNPGSPDGRVFASLELLLKDAKFEPGDTVGVQAVNNPREIDRLLDVLKLDAAQEITVGGKKHTLGDYLKSQVEIVRADVATVKLINAKLKSGEIHGNANVHLIDRAVQDWVSAENDKALDADHRRKPMQELAGSSIADLIEHFELKGLKVEDFKQRLRPREYTMSSALGLNPDKVHITYALVKYPVPLNKELRKYGVCTGYMDGLKPGDDVAVMMFSKPHFHLPGEHQAEDKPIIIIGAGTGIAPGRAFMQAIQARKDKGEKFSDVVLYSGAQYPADALYQGEMEKAHEAGVFTAKPSYAISRGGPKKVYMQDHLDRDASELRRMTSDGKGVVYICGAIETGNQVIDKLRAISPTIQEHQIHTDLY